MSLCVSRSLQWIFGIFSRTAVVLLACGPLSVAGNPASVRVVGSAWVGDAPTSLASHHDWFNIGRGPQEPVVKVSYAKSGKEALALVLNGQAEFALAGDGPVAGAILEAATVPTEDSPVVLAATALSTDAHHLVVDADKGITSAEDLAGRRIGVMYGTSAHYAWSRFCRIHDLCHARTELVDVHVQDMARLLEVGQLDAAVMWSPWNTRLQALPDARFQALSMRTVSSINWMLVTRRRVLEEYPGLAERILAGYLKATEAMSTRTADKIALHARETETPAGGQIPTALAWHLSMDWSLAASLEMHLRWIADRLGLNMPLPHLSQYMVAQPLYRVAPHRVRLSHLLSCLDELQECQP